MKVCELSIGKLTVIERVNWSWFFIYVVLVAYCTFRYWPDAVDYPWIILFLVNKLAGFKSKCSKKVYWGAQRVATFKIEDICAALVIPFFALLVTVQLRCTTRPKDDEAMCSSVVALLSNAGEMAMFCVFLATFVIGAIKKLKG